MDRVEGGGWTEVTEVGRNHFAESANRDLGAMLWFCQGIGPLHRGPIPSVQTFTGMTGCPTAHERKALNL